MTRVSSAMSINEDSPPRKSALASPLPRSRGVQSVCRVMADSGLLDETIRAVTMSRNGFVASLAPDTLNVGEDAVRESEICAVGLGSPISFLAGSATLIDDFEA